MKGILITKGVTTGFRPGDLCITVDQEGNEVFKADVSLHYDVVGTWMRVAFDSYRAAKAAWKSAEVIIKENDKHVPIEMLEIDFRQSMIVAISCAIAIDAFYARLTQFTRPPTKLVGNKRKSPRYSQVAEQIKNSYKINKKLFACLRLALRQIYEFRDQAVHPSGKLTKAVLYQEIDRGVEVRFEKYRSKNVRAVLQDSFVIIKNICENCDGKNKSVNDFSKTILREWNSIASDYSDVFSKTNSSDSPNTAIRRPGDL